MGLDVPDLDDRDFEDLLESARDRIPVHTDEWTDHNAHDPGITILEVLAYVVESDLYRLDRITDRHLEKYLALAGASPRGPEPATARVRVDPPPLLVGRTVPEGTALVATDATDVERPFETDAPVTLSDATVGAVVADHARGRTDAMSANRTDGLSFSPFGETAREGSACYVGFEGDPFVGGVQHLAVEYDDSGMPAPASHGDEASTFDPSVAVTWEYCTDYDRWHRHDAWSELSVLRDDTDDFYAGGIVELERPADWDPDPASILDHPRELRWIRCRIADGGHEVPPRLTRLSTNALTATHRGRVTGEPLSRVGSEGVDGGDLTTARPDQTFAFDRAPVLEATVTVGGDEWTRVDSFDASGPEDAHYVLDRSTGRLRFGDEVHGRVPEPDQPVVAERYVHGGGSDGNLTPPVRWRFAADAFDEGTVEADAVDDVTFAFGGASGGRDAESIEDALARLQRDRETPYRAVTAEDYEYVATHTPGLRFGRATAITERVDGGSEGREGCEAHKRVRVIVVPYSTRDRPEPSDAFLEAVRRHVQKHRLLTDRTAVDPPTYVGVGVSADIEVSSGYSEADRIRAVEVALDAFLDPLDGFDGDGWPFGRAVYRSEVFETVDAVEGVDCVSDVSLSPRGERAVDAAGNVLLADEALAYATDHDVTVRRDDGGCGGDWR